MLVIVCAVFLIRVSVAVNWVTCVAAALLGLLVQHIVGPGGSSRGVDVLSTGSPEPQAGLGYGAGAFCLVFNPLI